MPTDLTRKLRPTRFSEMSGLMAGIVGFILGEEWSEPPIRTLSVTSDGFVSTEGSLLEAADLDRNIANLLEIAELDPAELREFAHRYRTRVEDYRAHAPAWLATIERTNPR